MFSLQRGSGWYQLDFPADKHYLPLYHAGHLLFLWNTIVNLQPPAFPAEPTRFSLTQLAIT
ncbi:MAG: hypothetical protein ACRDCX_09635, partial [Aeromonas sp.]